MAPADVDYFLVSDLRQQVVHLLCDLIPALAYTSDVARSFSYFCF